MVVGDFVMSDRLETCGCYGIVAQVLEDCMVVVVRPAIYDTNGSTYTINVNVDSMSKYRNIDLRDYLEKTVDRRSIV